jgi:hypothetical protein
MIFPVKKTTYSTIGTLWRVHWKKNLLRAVNTLNSREHTQYINKIQKRNLKLGTLAESLNLPDNLNQKAQKHTHTQFAKNVV